MALSAHQVVTAFEQGWSTLRNAEPQKKPSKYTQSHLPPLIQSHQIPQLLDIKAAQPFFARADNFFGQH